MTGFVESAVRGWLPDLVLILLLTVVLDVGIFYAMPSHMEFDTAGVCPALSSGCTISAGSTHLAYVKQPFFSIEVHEYMHTQGHTDEIVPYIVSGGISLLLAVVSMMILKGTKVPFEPPLN